MTSLPRRFSHALFDVDGTLVDSIGEVERSWQAWATEYGLTPAVFGHGQTAVSVLEDLFSGEELEAALCRLRDIEVEFAVSVKPRRGALNLLRSIPAGRHGFVTSAERAVATARLAAAGISVPPVFVTGDDIKDGKPSPEGYLLGQTLLNVPGICVAFEDTGVGAAAARAANCFTVGVVGLESAAVLSGSCHALVKDLADVIVLAAREADGTFGLGGIEILDGQMFDLLEGG